MKTHSTFGAVIDRSITEARELVAEARERLRRVASVVEAAP